ncbi:MAG: hypothetical protein F4Y89_11835 [Gammaproteobacteria bacterium]|nr:hypothetical protein [Gammaproteobacteria bacterium]
MGEHMEPIDARSPKELKRKLRERDVSVPLRGMGQTKEHRETWAACRLLETLADSCLLRYPLRVEHTDRPDLIVTLPDSQIGIELVEAIATDQARFTEKINRKYANSESSGIEIIATPRFRQSDPQLTKPEMKALVSRTVSSKALNESPIMGDAFERDWLEGMIHCIDDKTDKFRKCGFTKKPTNWLQIYDNWRPHPHEHIVIKMLERELSDSGWKNPFDKVFVLGSRSIWEFGKDCQVVEHEILRSCRSLDYASSLVADAWLKVGAWLKASSKAGR